MKRSGTSPDSLRHLLGSLVLGCVLVGCAGAGGQARASALPGGAAADGRESACGYAGWSTPQPIAGFPAGSIARSPSLALRGERGYLVGNDILFYDTLPSPSAPLIAVTQDGRDIGEPAGDFLFMSPRALLGQDGTLHMLWTEPGDWRPRVRDDWGGGTLMNTASLWHATYTPEEGWGGADQVYAASQIWFDIGTGDNTLDPAGGLHVVIGDDSRQELMHLTYSGDGWRAEPIPGIGLPVYSSIAVDSAGQVYVAYVAPDRTVSSDANSVFFVQSPDGGRTWLPPRLISRSGNAQATQIHVLTASGGTVHLVQCLKNIVLIHHGGAIFPLMANRIRTVKLTGSERGVLEERARSQTLPQREVERARIVLLSADGKSNTEIQSALGVSRTKVQRWLDRYEEGGSEAVRTDLPRPGAPGTITPEKEAEVVRRTLEGPPAGAGTHWSTRTLAPLVGVSPASVGRIWKAHGLQPHRTKTFKLSNDPHFVEKLRDVVGLYVDPPERAVVLSVDEKSQVQALDRTQPGLPLKKGRAGTMTHDYKRHGTTTLFAALNVASGEVLGDCHKRHRHQEFLRFMRSVVKTVDRKLDIHVILDNYATHKHPKVKAWLAKNPRVHFHFVPTSSSWLNLIERFFGELSQRQLKRLAVTSVDQLINAIMAYINRRNVDPKPFVWTASVQHILEKVTKARATLEALH